MAKRLTKNNLYRTMIRAASAIVIGTTAVFAVAHHFAV